MIVKASSLDIELERKTGRRGGKTEMPFMFKMEVGDKAYVNSAAEHPAQAMRTLIRKGAFLSVGVSNNAPTASMTTEQKTSFEAFLKSFKVFQIKESSTPWDIIKASIDDQGAVADDGSNITPETVYIKRIA